MKRKDVRLYNVVVFPFWMMVAFPLYWFITIPLKILFTRLVLRHVLDRCQVLRYYSRKLLFRVLCLGVVADLAGGLMMFIPQFLPYSFLGIDADYALMHFILTVLYDPFANLPSLLWVLGTMALTSALIYWMNLKFTFSGFDPAIRKKLALRLALWTTPILFLIPSP